MAFNSNFSLHEDGYQAPEVKLEIKLKPYDKPPTNKTPALKGYMLISKSQLRAIERVIDASEGGSAYLQVALWDNKLEPGADGWAVEGVIEYKEWSRPKTEEEIPLSQSVWF